MKKELLIFGSEGALGKGVTECLRSKDYDKVYLFDRHAQGDPDPTTVSIVTGDLSIEDDVRKAFRKVSPSKDSAFFLFSTIGGFTGGKKVWDTPVHDLDKMINMNLKTSFLIAKYFSLLVKESHSGSLFFTAAITGLSPESGKAVYGASKGALIHLVKALAEEGKEINMSVNAMAPFIIDTPANRKWMKDADFSSWLKPVEAGELIHSVFNNYRFVTGNIIRLKYKF